MTVAVKDIAIALGPLWVIDRRLTYHTSSGNMLDGLIYNREGTLRIDGRNNLPSVQPVTFTDQEEWGVGAGGVLGTPIKDGIVFMLLVSAKREYGLFQRDPSNAPTGDDVNYEGVGVLEWAALVRDAIERKVDGTDMVDALLESTVSKPVLTSIREAPASDLAWSAVIELQIDIESICRGSRSFTP